MGATYTRQSTYSDGDVITAAHTNDEFNQLLAAFAASTGHTHDGTAAEGGPITKLLGNTLTFGAGTAGTDITVTFDGETNDGVLKWMEDEDYFEFSDDILVASTEKLQFRDTAIYINSSTDGQLDLVADTEIQLAATTVDLNGNLDVSGSLTLGGTAITSTAAELNILDGVTSTASELNILDGVTATTAELNIMDGVTATTAELNIMDGVTATTAELNIMDGVTTTATELNIIDGDTSATSTTLADADRVVVNDAGTMKQVALTDFETYFESALDTLSNVTTVGALDSGSITSGFGTIDTGSSTITTTGAITGGSLVVDNFTLNGTELDLSSGDFTLDVAGDIILNTDDGIVSLQDASATFGSLENSSGNLVIKSGTTTALTFSGANATIAGDLTISGDDLTMGTNTSGHIMVADGNNFNPVAVSGDVTIASNGAVTIANDAVETAMVNANVITGQSELSSAGVDITNDDLLIHDNDAGALKKVSVTNLISSAGGLTEVVADTTPQLGGDLDAQGKDLEDVGVSSADSHVGIYGSSSSPVEFTVTVGTKTAAHPYYGDGSSNAYFINGVESPALTLHGVDNVTSNSEYYYRFTLSSSDMSSHPFRLYLDADKTTAYTTGVTTTSTYLQIAVNEDTPSILYYQCSSHAYMGNHAIVLGSNKINHSEALISFPTTTGTLVGSGDTGTVTNDMLAGSIAASKLAGSIGDSKLSTISTAGKVELGALEIDGASDIGADLADADLIIVDDGAGGTEVKSELTRVKKYIYSAMSGDATASDAGALTIANDAVESGMLNDNIISGQTELASGLATTDELLVSDAGTIKRMDMSVVSTFMTSEGFSKEDPTALAIALG
jgi:hypothetical protein